MCIRDRLNPDGNAVFCLTFIYMCTATETLSPASLASHFSRLLEEDTSYYKLAVKQVLNAVLLLTLSIPHISP